MRRSAIFIVLATCILYRSHVASAPFNSSFELQNVGIVSKIFRNSPGLFLSPQESDQTLLKRARREFVAHCCGALVCKEAQRSNKNARYYHSTVRRRPTTSRPLIMQQFEPVNMRRKTTSMRPMLATFQYRKRKPGTRAIATYSQRGFAVACPDCAPGWQVLLSLEPAPPGRVPLTCLNCPPGWESLINLAPSVGRPMNYFTTPKIAIPQTTVPYATAILPGQTISSNGHNYVPLGPIIGPGGLLYVPVSPVGSSALNLTYDKSLWKLPSGQDINNFDKFGSNLENEDEITEEHSDDETEEEITEKGKKTTAKGKKGTTKAMVITVKGKQTTTKVTSKQSNKKTTPLAEEDDATGEDEITDEGESDSEPQSDDEEATTKKSKTTVGKTTAAKITVKATKGKVTPKGVITEEETTESTEAEETTGTTAKAALVTTVAPVTKAAATVPPTTKAAAAAAVASTAAPITTKAIVAPAITTITTKAAAVVPAATAAPPKAPVAAATAAPAAAPAGAPDMGALMAAAGGGGADVGGLLSSVGGAGGLGGMLGGAGGMLGSLGGMGGIGALMPKTTTKGVTGLPPEQAGADLGFEME